MNRAVIPPTAVSHHLEIELYLPSYKALHPGYHFGFNYPGLYSTVASVSHLTGENNGFTMWWLIK
jgi:hypothetical protein